MTAIPHYPSFDLTGKRALVTGATKGLGQHVPISLANAGAGVFVSGRNIHELDEVAAAVRALGRRAATQLAELADVDAVQRLGATAMEDTGGIDNLG